MSPRRYPIRHLVVGAAAVAALATGVPLAGCGAGRVPAPRTAEPASRPAPPDISGTWDWDVEERNEDGDTRMEREEWHLTQRGREIDGYYDRTLTVQSGDGRPFECYRDTRYQKFTRFRVAGSIEGRLVRLRETSYETRPDPCDAGRRSMTVYVGRLDGATLVLRWPPAGLQVLRRRGQTGPDSMSAATRVDAAPPAAVGGVWVWEWRTIDANGNERATREEWRLHQTRRQIQGFVDRTVRTVSGSGEPFACSGRPEKVVVVRAEVVGEVNGRRVQLREVGQSQLAGTPCRPGDAALTWHEGDVGVGEMVLSATSAGAQRHVLRRIGPDAGTR